MPLIKEKVITRRMAQEHPDWVFVFGDNLAGVGLGGQAAALRGEPNTVGIPTKRAPRMADNAFFSNADLHRCNSIFSIRFARLQAIIQNGGTVVMPADGIGTGRAQLAKRAPAIWESLQLYIAALEAAAAVWEQSK